YRTSPAELPGDEPELPGNDGPNGDEPDDPNGNPAGTDGTPVESLPDWLPAIGDPVAKIEIPDIGITRTVVEGDDDPQLKRGMGHVDWTPYPGQAGNVSIAGHRTTYGQPLHNIDKIPVGGLIHVETIQGEFTYEV